MHREKNYLSRGAGLKMNGFLSKTSCVARNQIPDKLQTARQTARQIADKHQ